MSWELTTRKYDWGEGLVPVKPKKRGPRDDPMNYTHKRLIFFIHGYNNAIGRAERIWRTKTEETLYHILKKEEWLDETVYFYWPGDIWWVQAVSAPSYYRHVKTAQKAALELAIYLEKLRPEKKKIKLYFVAHSLGCLLALETLALLRERKSENVEVVDVLLMAAAVPEGLCYPKSSARYGKKVAKGHERVLYSSRDGTLGWVFRAGQKMASMAPLLGPGAVGKSGLPMFRWSGYHKDTRLKHGQYWKHKRSLQKIADLIEPPLFKELPEVEPQSQEMPEGRHLAEHEPLPRDPMRTRNLSERPSLF